MTDEPAWKYVDDIWEKIKEGPRNLWLGLSANGINWHSSLSITTVVGWLLLLFIIFLLHWLWKEDSQCWHYWHRDIDMFLAPLTDDLKFLWNGVPNCYDNYKDGYVTLRAVLLFTINDYPALCYLMGYSGKAIKDMRYAIRVHILDGWDYLKNHIIWATDSILILIILFENTKSLLMVNKYLN